MLKTSVIDTFFKFRIYIYTIVIESKLKIFVSTYYSITTIFFNRLKLIHSCRPLPILKCVCTYRHIGIICVYTDFFFLND